MTGTEGRGTVRDEILEELSRPLDAPTPWYYLEWLQLRFRDYLLLFAGGVLILLFVAQSSGDTSATAVSGEIRGRQVDRDNLPQVYVGEVIDIDNDGVDDLALFGDPDAPILRPLVPDRDDAPIVAATIAAIGTIVGATVVGLLKLWTQSRQAGSGEQTTSG